MSVCNAQQILHLHVYVNAQSVRLNKKCYKLSPASENERKSFSGSKSSVLWIFKIISLFKLFCTVWEEGVKMFTISKLSLFTWDLRVVLQVQGSQLITWTKMLGVHSSLLHHETNGYDYVFVRSCGAGGHLHLALALCFVLCQERWGPRATFSKSAAKPSSVLPATFLLSWLFPASASSSEAVVSPSWGTPASMFQFLKLATDSTHFQIMMHKDVTRNNAQTL